MSPNIDAITQFVEKSRRLAEQEAEVRKVADEEKACKTEHEQLRKLRYDEFKRGYKEISGELKRMYQMITMGGDAELELIDQLDPFAEGVMFSVRPLKKSWKQMSKLSGGEKTLSSLALIFALHKYKPTPLYCMDEIDAALDYRNVAIVGKYIKTKAFDAQFIIISLRNNMFELADKLVGIYKTHDVTKTVTIVPERVRSEIERRRREETGEGEKENVADNGARPHHAVRA